MLVASEPRVARTRTFAEWLEWASAYVRAAGESFAPTRYRVDPKGRTLCCGKKILRKGETAQRLLAAAEWYVTRDWAERLAAQYLICHAAVLECQGRALMAVGSAGVGKSTLALELVRRGFGYLSDEYAVICRRTFEVFPFPTGLRIKGPENAMVVRRDPRFDTISYLPNSTRRNKIVLCCLPRKEIVPPPGARFPVRWIIFLRDEVTSAFPADMPRWQATTALCKSTLYSEEEPFRTVAAVVREAKVWEAGRVSLTTMADWIESLTRGQR